MSNKITHVETASKVSADKKLNAVDFKRGTVAKTAFGGYWMVVGSDYVQHRWAELVDGWIGGSASPISSFLSAHDTTILPTGTVITLVVG